MRKHHRRKSSRAGREDKKPTDVRRQDPDDLHTLSYTGLKKTGFLREQVSAKGKLYYNVVVDGVPRTVKLDKPRQRRKKVEDETRG